MKCLRYGIQVMTENIATDTKGILGMTADIFRAVNPRVHYCTITNKPKHPLKYDSYLLV